MVQGPETDVSTWVEALLQAMGQLQDLLLWEAKLNQWGGGGGWDCRGEMRWDMWVRGVGCAEHLFQIWRVTGFA